MGTPLASRAAHVKLPLLEEVKGVLNEAHLYREKVREVMRLTSCSFREDDPTKTHVNANPASKGHKVPLETLQELLIQGEKLAISVPERQFLRNQLNETTASEEITRMAEDEENLPLRVKLHLPTRDEEVDAPAPAVPKAKAKAKGPKAKALARPTQDQGCCGCGR
ncbi:unnamed protein product [Vitrella brassicaformis CCMP3155]|uniref:Uncharacterized protein n=1 Tax=Vitrella brassicaformis (strain CCMP3155) TaxID=1169540 RepID=A0A0G4GYJ7_VITBC|nr:unnamed protein product [Vitrella brassicaformis CCMP3155]|eukprot:CEM36203.1 unnamed protein product [Vitrella brassicaformis CCMP3155]